MGACGSKSELAAVDFDTGAQTDEARDWDWEQPKTATPRRESWAAGEVTESLSPRSSQLPTESVGLYSNHGIQPVHEKDFDGSAKINQDRGMVTHPVGTNTRQVLLGVYDGHGKHGELCADFVSHALAELIDEERDLMLDAKYALKRAFHTADANLRGAEQIPSDLSGTTAIVALLREKRVTAPPIAPPPTHTPHSLPARALRYGWRASATRAA